MEKLEWTEKYYTIPLSQLELQAIIAAIEETQGQSELYKYLYGLYFNSKFRPDTLWVTCYMRAQDRVMKPYFTKQFIITPTERATVEDTTLEDVCSYFREQSCRRNASNKHIIGGLNKRGYYSLPDKYADQYMYAVESVYGMLTERKM